VVVSGVLQSEYGDPGGVMHETVGKNIPNTPMLGAFVKLTNTISLDALNNKVKDMFLKKIGEEKTNMTIEGIKKAHDII